MSRRLGDILVTVFLYFLSLTLRTLSLNLVSILMPLYNEEECVRICLQRVLEAKLPEGWTREIIVVDDGSTDRSVEIVEEFAAADASGAIRLIRHERNQGKGAAVCTALDNARGEFSIIQDSDLEYDPADYERLLQPLLAQQADAVFDLDFSLPALGVFYFIGIPLLMVG